jgi:predicted DNA repair protein MutK
MPGSLLLLLDDIAGVLDDVAVLAKVATKKTAGVLGDDLALNAEQVSNVRPDRELPVVWAVAKGSLLNKTILVPLALLISAITPWLVVPLLMIGGAFLCYEGFEKLAHKLLHRGEDRKRRDELAQVLSDPEIDLVAIEKPKIRAAIRTDFILSAEILVIALGTAVSATLLEKALLLGFIAIAFTILVYGVVALIVKLDDVGVLLVRKRKGALRTLGAGILRAAPYLIRALTIAGTAAMFLVGGGIVVHGVPPLHGVSSAVAASGGFVGAIAPTLFDALVGIVLGGLAVLIVSLVSRLVGRLRQTATLAIGGVLIAFGGVEPVAESDRARAQCSRQ